MVVRNGKNMQIGVFGDSYVEPWNPAHNLATEVLDWKYATRFHSDTKPFIWHKHLQQLDPLLKVHAYGQGGCDNWWIYSSFLEHQEKYDKIIICWTHDSRYSWSTNDLKVHQERHWLHATNLLTTIEKSKHYDGGQKFKDDYKAMIDFLERVYYVDEKRYKTFSRMLREDIKRIRPDTMFINCFDNDDQDHNNLFEITRYESNQLNIPLGTGVQSNHGHRDTDLDRLYDCRIAHLTKPSHETLARQVATAIDLNHTSLTINLNSFSRTMTKQDRREYWTKRDILKYANRYYDAGLKIH